MQYLFQGKEGKMVGRMKARNVSAIKEGTVAIVKLDMARDMGGKSAGVAKKAKAMEIQASKKANHQKELRKANKRLSSKVQKMQAKATQSNAQSSYETLDMTSIEIENKGAVHDFVELAKAKSTAVQTSTIIDRSQLAKVQTRGPVEALRRVLAAAKEQASGTAYEKTVVNVDEFDEFEGAIDNSFPFQNHRREEDVLREKRMLLVAEAAAVVGLAKEEQELLDEDYAAQYKDWITIY
jgi:hypothetical protein